MTLEEAAAALAERPPRAHTELTLTDPDTILEAVDEVRSTRYALVDGEIEVGFLVTAVPVFDANSETIAALSVNSTSPRVSKEQALTQSLPTLKQHADRVSRLTGPGRGLTLSPSLAGGPLPGAR